MSFNLTRLQGWCSFLAFPNGSERTSIYYTVTLTNCVVSALLAPMAIVANALILAAIWKNPSLRTPSYVLLAGLAFTDFCSGLLIQPFFALYQWAVLKGNIEMFCITGVVTQSVGSSLSSLTGTMMTMIAVERWLHMSRRSLLAVRRVVKFSILSLQFCFLLHAHLVLYQILSHYQNQLQRKQKRHIDIQKYKNYLFTFLFILAIFVQSYVSSVCCVAVVRVAKLLLN